MKGETPRLIGGILRDAFLRSAGVRKAVAAGPVVTMSPMTDTEPIRRFIRQQFLFDKDAPLADDQELFPGIVDSLGVMELADFVETTYGVQIGEDELLADNFSSLSAIAALVERKQA